MDLECIADRSSATTSRTGPAIAESVLNLVPFSTSEGSAAPTSNPASSPEGQIDRTTTTIIAHLTKSEPCGTEAPVNPEPRLDNTETETTISIALVERRNELHELARLKRDLVRLQEENTRLEEENDNFRDELLDSEHTIAHLLKVIEISNRGKSPVTLPNEIYRMIFLRVVPPYSFLDTSLCGGPCSAWNSYIKCIMNIIMVCKRWAEIGMEILYECVVFRRLGQVFAFSQTLDLRPDLGRLVKRIEIRCYVPKHCMSAYVKVTTRVFNSCAPIGQIIFDPLLPSWPAFCNGHAVRTGSTLHDHETYTRTSLDVIPLNITHLELGRTVPLEQLGARLPSFQHLRSLTLQLPHMYGYISEDDIPECPVAEIGLHHLSLDVGRCSLYPFKKIYAEWSMPLLRQLRIHVHDDSELASFCFKFLSKHGGRLQYLHIHPCCLNYPTDILYATLNITCPVLEHLVLHPGAVLPPMHPTLALVDIWTAKFPAHKNRVSDLQRSLQQRNAFPHLRRTRTLDRGLPTNVDWPLIFPPDENLDNMPLDAEYEYPYLHIRVDIDGIFRLDLPPWDNEENIDVQDVDEMESDDDYVPPSESQSDDHSSDSSWVSDSDVDEGARVGSLDNIHRQETSVVSNN